MKIVFISGVKFGYGLLSYILEKGWEISALFTYSDAKSKFYSDFSSFNDLSQKYKIQHVKVNNINDNENVELLRKINPDIILVMGWSQLLHENLLSIPRIGIIGSHPTELPKYRGRAPIPWSIIKNLQESALTFFWIELGTDNGSILDQEKFLITNKDDATSLYEKITTIGKTMLIKNLNLIKNGKIIRRKQDESKFIEYWEKRVPEDGKIDWTKSCREIHNLIRASTYPYPGAFTFFKGTKLKIWKAIFLDIESNEPGKILEVNDDDVKTGTGNGIILLKLVSWKDKEKISASKLFSQQDKGEILGD